MWTMNIKGAVMFMILCFDEKMAESFLLLVKGPEKMETIIRTLHI